MTDIQLKHFMIPADAAADAEDALNRSHTGLPFLGFLVLPGQLRLTSRTCRRMRRKLRACQRDLDHALIDQPCAAVIVHSLLARTPQAQGNGRMSSVEPGDDPVPAMVDPSRDEVRDGGRVLVGRVDARLERPRSPFLFPEMEDDRMNR